MRRSGVRSPSAPLTIEGSQSLPLGVTGNTPDSGSGESWFDPRRGNSKRDATLSRVALLVFRPSVIVSVIVSPDTILTSLDVARGFRGVACKRFSGVQTQS